jgi:hypothetical protein
MSRISKDNSELKVAIGSVTGCLVNRWESCGKFFEVVDCDSQELQGAGCCCFDNMGEVYSPLYPY